MNIEETGAKRGQGETGGGGQRTRSQNRQAHMRQGEQGFRQGAEVARPPGEADDFVDGGAGFAELSQKPFEAERGQFSFQGVGGKNEIPFGTADGTQHAAQPGKIGQFQVCLLYTSPSPRDLSTSRMPSSA